MSPRANGAWPTARLGELFRIKHGYAFKGEYFASSGPYVLLTPGNFQASGGIQLRGDKEKYYVGEVPREYLLQQDDLLVVMTDLTQNAPILGSPAFIASDNRYLHNQRLGKIVDVDEKRVSRRFLYHLLNTEGVRGQIKGSATGATVRHTAPERIYAVEVRLPPLEQQATINRLLDSFLLLVKNNSRRVELLEEMLRLFYDGMLRKAGRGTIPQPEGWTIKSLGDLAYEKRVAVSPKEVDPSTPYIGLEHIPRRSIALSEWETAGTVQSSKLRFGVRDILFAKIRPYLYKVAIAPVSGVCSSDTIVIVPKESEYFGLVLTTVSGQEFVDYASQTAQGTKMPRANWSVLSKHPVTVPPPDLIQRLNAFAEVVADEIRNLVLRNRALIQMQSTIAPSLMSGRIDLSTIAATRDAA